MGRLRLGGGGGLEEGEEGWRPLFRFDTLSATAIGGEERQPTVRICEVKGDPTALRRENDPARRASHPSRGGHGRPPELDAASALREDETALGQCEGSVDPARRAVGACRESRCETMLVWFERGWAVRREPLSTARGVADLRAERSGTGPGRTYTIHCTATDTSGNVTSKDATVTVAH